MDAERRVAILADALDSVGLRPTATELDLQDAIARVFRSLQVPARREARISREDRPDFMVGAVGVEVKIEGAAKDVLRQLLSYAHNPIVDGLVLVTTRGHHEIPATLNGKPVRRVWVQAW